MEQNPFKNKEKLTIRVELANPEDWRACKRVRIQAITGDDAQMFRATPEKIAREKDAGEKEWKEKLFGSDAFGVLSWNGSEPVGIGLAKKREEKEDWCMYAGYVKPELRGGVGRKMFAMRLNEILNRGGKKVTMAVEVGNSASIRIAESFGFKKVEEGADELGFFMQLEDVNNPEVVKKINEVLNER